MKAGIVNRKRTPVPRDDKTVNMIGEVHPEQWTPEEVETYLTEKYGKLNGHRKKEFTVIRLGRGRR